MFVPYMTCFFSVIDSYSVALHSVTDTIFNFRPSHSEAPRQVRTTWIAKSSALAARLKHLTSETIVIFSFLNVPPLRKKLLSQFQYMIISVA